MTRRKPEGKTRFLPYGTWTAGSSSNSQEQASPLVNGQIDGAHCLYSMPAALATLGNQPDHPLRIAMMLNRNGQAITLNAKDFDGVGYADLAGFRSKLEAKPDKLAMTYPGARTTCGFGTCSRRRSSSRKPIRSFRLIPPPQMVANMAAGTMSGYCVGEPWNAKAVADGVCFTFITSQDIWQDHPEKALVVGAKLSADEDTLGDMIAAVLDRVRIVEDPAFRRVHDSLMHLLLAQQSAAA